MINERDCGTVMTRKKLALRVTIGVSRSVLISLLICIVAEARALAKINHTGVSLEQEGPGFLIMLDDRS